MTYFSPTISMAMWSLWPLIMDALQDWAVDFFESNETCSYTLCCSFTIVYNIYFNFYLERHSYCILPCRAAYFSSYCLKFSIWYVLLALFYCLRFITKLLVCLISPNITRYKNWSIYAVVATKNSALFTIWCLILWCSFLLQMLIFAWCFAFIWLSLLLSRKLS